MIVGGKRGVRGLGELGTWAPQVNSFRLMCHRTPPQPSSAPLF